TCSPERLVCLIKIKKHIIAEVEKNLSRMVNGLALAIKMLQHRPMTRLRIKGFLGVEKRSPKR
ncbi:MAG: hypothetical protein WCT46_02960, partial [Candidatus Gracilibacteria bacterium]